MRFVSEHPHHGTTLNMVLGGGGVKGVAYAGVFDVVEKRGYSIGNIAGVSAGAMAGCMAGAGYNADELGILLDTLDFDKIDENDICRRVPIIEKYMKLNDKYRILSRKSVELFLDMLASDSKEDGIRDKTDRGIQPEGYRSSIIKSIITYSKQGSLFNGDYLEEWVYKALLKKGIKTFGDMKGGIIDRQNPNGYRVRMTGVDTNRMKVVTLPDDVVFYGLEPNRFEVAKAVRISTCAPFAFKPVEIKKREGNNEKTYSLVDGGVLDSFPYWAVDSAFYDSTVGFKLAGGEHKLLSINTPLNVFKFIVSALHDLGVPKTSAKLVNVASINTSNVSFLDFNLGEAEKKFLYDEGRKTASMLFDSYERRVFGRLLKKTVLVPLMMARKIFK